MPWSEKGQLRGQNACVKGTGTEDGLPGKKKLSGLGPVLFPFMGTNPGGSHISTFLLAKSLAEDFGIETVIVAIEGSRIATEARRRGLEVQTIPAPWKKHFIEPRDVTHFGRRRNLLRSQGDRVIVHCSDIWTMIAFGPATKSLKLPLVYHNRTLNKGRIVDRLAVSLADAVICISEACRQSLRGAPDDIIVDVVNPFIISEAPIDRAAARAEFEALWPIENLQLVGSSGNFVRRKRADFFIHAAAAVAKENPCARFVMFGTPRDHSTEDLIALSQSLGIRDLMFFAGFRSPPERNLVAMDVLAAPALAEPFGRTLVEALLLGVPYVATDDAGHAEISRHWGGGILVEREASATKFAQGLLEVLADPAAIALKPAHINKVANDLRPEAHAAKIIEVYRSVSA